MNEDNLKSIRILVVDDSDVIQQTLKQFFEDYFFEVTTCSDGLEGLQKAVELKPAVIFLDLMMPNFDGLKMLQVKKVLAEIKDIPVIVISANTDRRNVLAAIEAGADKVVSKPLQKNLIMRYLNELIGDKLFEHQKEHSGTKHIEKSDEHIIKTDLVQFFIESFSQKKEKIIDSLNRKDFSTLKTLAHEIKGSGGTIGHMELSKIAEEIESKEIRSETDWMYIELKCSQLFQQVKKIKDEVVREG